MQVTPSEAARSDRAAAAHPDATPQDLTALCRTTAEATENLRVAHVALIIDDHTSLALADLRNVLSAALRHHLDPTLPALVVAGAFGTGKRQLLQRMLTLYPTGFQLPPVYTTKSDAQGGNLSVVSAEELDAMRASGMLIYEQVVLGETYAVSLLDVRRCAPLNPLLLLDGSIVHDLPAQVLQHIHLRSKIVWHTRYSVLG